MNFKPDKSSNSAKNVKKSPLKNQFILVPSSAPLPNLEAREQDYRQNYFHYFQNMARFGHHPQSYYNSIFPPLSLTNRNVIAGPIVLQAMTTIRTLNNSEQDNNPGSSTQEGVALFQPLFYTSYNSSPFINNQQQLTNLWAMARNAPNIIDEANAITGIYGLTPSDNIPKCLTSYTDIQQPLVSSSSIIPSNSLFCIGPDTSNLYNDLCYPQPLNNEMAYNNLQPNLSVELSLPSYPDLLGFQYYPYSGYIPCNIPRIAGTTTAVGAASTGKEPVLLPRGPPKKPSKSGHALWVGNLPLATRLEELCHIFGSKGILSIFLIERTNCAFINYKSHQAAVDVLKEIKAKNIKLRESKLMVKIQVQTQEDKSKSNDSIDFQQYLEHHRQNNRDKNNEMATEMGSKSVVEKKQSISNKYTVLHSPQMKKQKVTKDRYFICKSLTIEDIEGSRRLGIWSAQTHNEAIFNEAFETSENVFLFFSANRTGQFYGYARMETKISTSDGRFIDLAKETAQPVSLISSSTSLSVIASDLNPKVTLTKADDSIPIPAGRIVDDSARGSLFWEILDEKSELISDNTATMESKPHFIPSERNWSTPFRIKWLSPSGKTLPFYKTRHLQNSFNNNHPVKVARDGTEIDPNVGQQLIALFHSG